MTLKKIQPLRSKSKSPRKQIEVPRKERRILSSDMTPKTGVESLIEMKAFGVNLMGEGGLPILILRDEAGHFSLPVPLSPMDAGLALSQSSTAARPSSPHKAAAHIFKAMNVKVTQAVFEEIRLQKQLLRVFFTGHPVEKSLLMPAEDAMTLCLHLEVPIYASTEFIKKSQELVSELQGLMEGIRSKAGMLKRNHAFIQ